MLIGEVSAQSGISARMLRHYDKIGLVPPTGRTEGGYRQYSEEDLRRLFHVEALRSLGLNLHEVADALGNASFSPAALVTRLLNQTQERLDKQHELLGRLSQVQASTPAAWSEVIHTVGLMRRLSAGDPSSRQRTALSLINELEGNVVPLVEAVLNEQDPNVAGASVWALARTGDRTISLLAEALDSPDTGRRRRAVEALEKIGTERAFTTLADASGNSDPLVGDRAVLARATFGRRDSIPALVALIVEGRYDVEASDALTRIALQSRIEGDVGEAIADALSGADVPVRRRLAGALAGIPGSNAQTTLQYLATDSDAGVAATAIFLLKQRRGDENRSGPFRD